MTNNTQSPTFVETIRISRGKAERLPLHAARMERTMRKFFPDAPAIGSDQLENYIYNNVCLTGSGIMKCRIVYAQCPLSVSLEPYTVREVRSLKLVDGAGIDYAYKSTDRRPLTNLFSLRGEADDVLIVKDGRITDTTIGNVALLIRGKWLTPANPLLKGTRRKALLDEGVIEEGDIRPDDIQDCKSIMVFNAMIPWGRIEVSPLNCTMLK